MQKKKVKMLVASLPFLSFEAFLLFKVVRECGEYKRRKLFSYELLLITSCISGIRGKYNHENGQLQKKWYLLPKKGYFRLKPSEYFRKNTFFISSKIR